MGRKKRYHQYRGVGVGVGINLVVGVGVGVTGVGEVVTVTIGAEVVVGEGETIGVGVGVVVDVGGVTVGVMGELIVKKLFYSSWVAEPTPPRAASTIFILCNPVLCMIGEFTIQV